MLVFFYKKAKDIVISGFLSGFLQVIDQKSLVMKEIGCHCLDLVSEYYGDW